MWTRLFYISILLLFTLSCSKEIVTYNREDNIELDTLTLQVGAYVTHPTVNQVDIEISMLILNGLNSETHYSNSTFHSVESLFYGNNVVGNVSSTVISNETATSNYASVFLFETGNRDWYNRHNIGPYLRRFLELNPSTNKVGISYFNQSKNDPIHFTHSNSTSIFEIEWEKQINQFYSEISDNSSVNANQPIQNLLNRLDEAIDSLNNVSSNAKSITLFTNGFYNSSNLSSNDSTEFINLITKATTNQIELNIIGEDLRSIRRLAFETGGFWIENNINSVTNDYEYYENKISNIGMAMENMELLLSKKYTFHSGLLTLTDTSFNNHYISGVQDHIQYNYNDFQYTIEIELP